MISRDSNLASNFSLLEGGELSGLEDTMVRTILLGMSWDSRGRRKKVRVDDQNRARNDPLAVILSNCGAQSLDGSDAK
jgi:hypothetical protein